MPSPEEQREEGRRAPLLDPIDTVLAAGLIGLCAYLYYVTTQFDEVSFLLGDNILPEHFPRLTLWIIGVLALIIPFEHRLFPRRWSRIKAERSSEIPAITWATIVFLIAVVAIEPYTGTILTILLVTLAMPVLWGERRWWLVVSYSIFFTALITYVFNQILRVFFEPGVFNISI